MKTKLAILLIATLCCASCAQYGVINGVAQQDENGVVQFQPIPAFDIGPAPHGASLILHDKVAEVILDSGK